MKHANAIGYILELKSVIQQNWFDSVIEHMLTNETYCFDEPIKQKLLEELIAVDAYSNKAITPSASSRGVLAGTARETIVSLYNFDNFKKLESFLKVGLHSRATIIFGANGAGKSSLCAAFKCLAGKTTDGPLHNVNNNSSNECSFEFDTVLQANQRWQSLSPTSQLASRIKFFDSKLALIYASPKADPKKFIEITPYSLHLFELLRNYINDTETYWNNNLEEKRSRLTRTVAAGAATMQHLRSEIARCFIEKLTQHNSSAISEYLAKLDETTIATRLSAARKEKGDFTAAIQIEGKKLLSLEINTVRTWLREISVIAETIKSIDIEDNNAVLETLNLKKQEQSILVRKVIPDGCTIDNFKTFLDASRAVFKYDGTEQCCPFCQRDFSEREKNLIAEYARFLISPLETEISSLAQKTTQTSNKILEIKAKDYTSITIRDGISDSFKSSLKNILDTLRQNLENYSQANQQPELCEVFKNANAKFSEFIIEVEKYLESKVELERIANTDTEEQNKKLSELQVAVEALELEETLLNNMIVVQQAVVGINEYEKIQKAITTANISNVRRQLSTKSKQAYSELVVPQFHDNLNSEYRRLAERDMSSFGIEFRSKVSDVDVSVESHVKSQRIDVVLSEGELKVHALALFFAELRYSSEDIIILDDPINSLDDKYSISVGHRIRDCIKENPDKQIVLLTHNYSFFVQLIQIFNKSSIGSAFCPLVLDSCGLVERHSESISDLEAKIEAGLIAMPFDAEVKTTLAKSVRLYIEAIVNTHVFNKCRKAYHASPAISEFHKYVELVPLTPKEATTLCDIYRSVSPWEHDDIRTWYLNSEKPAVQTRYEEVKKIKDALESRKP